MKKIIISLITLTVGSVIIYFSIFLIQNFTLKRSVSQDYGDNIVFDGDIRDFVRCNMNILKPEFAYLYKIGKTADADFYKPKHLFSQTEQEWDDSYTGGTTIKNTTFPELVAMVKEDCNQFQDGGSKGEIEWRYSKAPTQDEIKQDKIDFVHRAFYQLEDNVKEVFIEKYGNVDKMPDEDKILIYNEVQEKGWDLEFDKIRVITEARMDLSQLPEDQKRKIISRYGDWKNLNDNEFFEWKAVIEKDYESGKFSLD